MPLLRINARGDQPVLHGSGRMGAALVAALRELPSDAPIVVLIHGYRFSPALTASCPHDHILSLDPDPTLVKAVSWPRHLGFGRNDPAEGLCVAFGWQSNGSAWSAWRRAKAAGAALADLIHKIRKHRTAPVDIMAHSMGARVALAAIPDLPAGAIGRTILMMAAEYQDTAVAALSTDAGRSAEIINVTSRENDLFDALVEWALQSPVSRGRTLGDGLGVAANNWADIRLDCAFARAALAEFGYRIPPPARRVCHWSAYLRPGVFRLYRDLIRNRDVVTIDRLRQVLPRRAAPRWSMLWPALPRISARS